MSIIDISGFCSDCEELCNIHITEGTVVSECCSANVLENVEGVPDKVLSVREIQVLLSKEIKNIFRCPQCDEVLYKFTPLVFSGEGIKDLTCYNTDCPITIHIGIREKSI